MPISPCGTSTPDAVSTTRNSTPGNGKPTVPAPTLAVVRIRRAHRCFAHAVAFKNAVARTGLERPMGLGQQRRGSRNEEPHVPCHFTREARIVQKPAVKGRHSHHRSGLRQQLQHAVDIELRQEDHPSAGSQQNVCRHEQPMRVKDRQGMEQGVRCSKAPGLNKRVGVRQEVVMAQHCTFRAPGRARGVKDRGRFVGVASDSREILGRFGRTFDQRAGRRPTERQQRDSLGVGHRSQRCLGGRGADRNARLCIAEKIVEFGSRVRGVERQKQRPGAQAGKVQGQRLGRLLRLHRHPVAGLHSNLREHVGDPAGQAMERVAGHLAAVRPDQNRVRAHFKRRCQRICQWIHPDNPFQSM